MALQKRVSELPAVTTVAGTDLLIVSSNNATKRTSVQQIGAYFAANGVAGPQGPVGPAGAPGATNYTQLTNVPSTFPPSAHGHTITDVSGLQTALDGKQATGSYVLTTDARLSDARQPLTHTHTASQISDFTAAVIAAAPPTVDASLLTQGTIPDARLSSAIARTSDVTAAVASVVGAAPESLNTLQELSAALANDASFSATVTNSLAGKAPINNPTFTGTVGGISAAMVGLGNVNNTSDASKPVSTAQAAADAAVASAAAADATTKANAAQAAAVQRANHTGTQAISTVSGLQAALDAKASLADPSFTGLVDVNGTLSANTLGADLVETPAVRFPSGHDIAHASGALSVRLGAGAFQAIVLANDSRLSDARTPTAHKSSHATGGTDALTPGDIGAAGVSHTHSASQVTDFASAVAAAAPAEVLDFLTAAQFPATGLASKIYVATDHSRAYQWTGSQYAEIGPAGAYLPSHVHSAAEITSGVIAAARIGAHATTHNPGGSDPVTLVEVYEFTRTSRPAAASGSGGSYTFTIPAAAKAVELFSIGGGGAGGSGRRGAAGSARFGGGGGGSAGVMMITRQVSDLSTRTITVTVGQGGVGGAAVTSDDTNGNSGGVANDTTIVIGSQTYYAGRGFAGSGGTAAAGSGGGTSNSMYLGVSGGNSSVTAIPSGPNPTSLTGAGAPAGGGISTVNVGYAGGSGRAQGWFVNGSHVSSNGGTFPGGAGQSASVAFTGGLANAPGGAGGGGAAGDATTPGGNGGDGAAYGGAGGGGGASVNGRNSGAGGNGGDGYVRITVWY